MAQDIGYQVVQVMAKRIRSDTPRPLAFGSLPTGAVVLGGVTQVIEPFEGGGSFHVGTRDKPEAYGSLSLGSKGYSNFAQKVDPVTSTTDLWIISPEEEREAPAHHAKAETKAEAAHEKDARNRAARAEEAKAKKPEPEPEKPAKGEAVVVLTFIVVP